VGWEERGLILGVDREKQRAFSSIPAADVFRFKFYLLCITKLLYLSFIFYFNSFAWVGKWFREISTLAWFVIAS